jgi:hypothetical protein
MSNSTFFVQECPTCGRHLQIHVEYLGKQVICQHCRGRLIACDPNSNRYGGGSAADALLKRAADLLHDVSEGKFHDRASASRSWKNPG